MYVSNIKDDYQVFNNCTDNENNISKIILKYLLLLIQVV